MHLYFFARGILSQIEVWKILMQSQFFYWERKNLKTGEQENILVQGSLRPSLFGTWEFVFPEECLAEVLSLMGIDEGSENWGSSLQKTGMTMLRKALGCEKIPQSVYDEAKQLPNSIVLTNRKRGLSHAVVKGVIIHTIGIKKDRREENEFFGYEQEML